MPGPCWALGERRRRDSGCKKIMFNIYNSYGTLPRCGLVNGLIDSVCIYGASFSRAFFLEFAMFTIVIVKGRKIYSSQFTKDFSVRK